jgi:alanine racemase
MFRKQAKKLLSRVSKTHYRTLNCIQLSKNNILSNITLIQNQHPRFGIMPVLKGNAYGHGLTQVATILNDAQCSFVAVDGYFEANKIRNITKHPILVMGYIHPQNAVLLDSTRCSFVIQDIESLKAFGRLDKKVAIHLELNTGMNRLGLSENELSSYLKTFEAFPSLRLEGVMTHLADADNDDDDSFTHKQVRQFDHMIEKIRDFGFDPQYVHVAQTAGSTKAKSKYANNIRLGMGLYGINSLGPNDNYFRDLEGLKPVLELTSTIIKITDLKQGDKVSYNGTFTAPKKMKIGVLPIGYYEGIPRELGNIGSVGLNSTQLPIVGKICMNHTMIDLLDKDVKVGSKVIIISNSPSHPNSIEQLCKRYNLFSYLLLSKLSSSIRRVVTD